MKQRRLLCDFKLKLDDKLIIVEQKECGEHSHTRPPLVQPHPRVRGSERPCGGWRSGSQALSLGPLLGRSRKTKSAIW